MKMVYIPFSAPYTVTQQIYKNMFGKRLSDDSFHSSSSATVHRSFSTVVILRSFLVFFFFHREILIFSLLIMPRCDVKIYPLILLTWSLLGYWDTSVLLHKGSHTQVTYSCVNLHLCGYTSFPLTSMWPGSCCLLGT